MSLSDERLLEFDADRLDDFDRLRAEHDLEEQGDLYRNHLVIAHWIDGWIESVVGQVHEGQEVFKQTLREIAAHLRQGDFLPGREMHETTVVRLRDRTD
ncbi:MAG: hypothetical protein M3O23_04595 [Actinomycetota bacterium]|nr:hypothetical protein [Actinomycetota bacterium]